MQNGRSSETYRLRINTDFESIPGMFWFFYKSPAVSAGLFYFRRQILKNGVLICTEYVDEK